MKPAPSIIGFTTSSGLGYGMLFVLAAGAFAGLIPTDRWLGVIGLAFALGMITLGLLASTFHLGHPERAWRAVTQWRSSWLSREGLLALVTYVPAVVFAAGWIVEERIDGFIGLMALVAAIGGLATVYCTGMIYAALPPIRAWNQPLTAPIYVAFALMTGLLAVNLLLTLFGAPHEIIGSLAMAAVAAAFALKIAYWRKVESEATHGPTMSSATGLGSPGLGASGLVRMLDPPHTQTSYLLDEMGFQIGRKHARRLKMLVFTSGLFLPLILTLATLVLSGWPTIVLAFFAFLSGMTGVLLERWLFFAQAEHTVMLYYGGQQAPKNQWQAPASHSSKRSRRAPSVSATPRRRRGLSSPKRAVVQGDDQAAGR